MKNLYEVTLTDRLGRHETTYMISVNSSYKDAVRKAKAQWKREYEVIYSVDCYSPIPMLQKVELVGKCI